MPEQCPECGRFLKNDLVASLGGGDASCPKCGTALTSSMFRTAGGTADAAAPDVLAGWDEGDPAPPAAGGEIVIALEPDEAVLAGVCGGIVGALLLRRRRGAGAVLGALVGILAGGLLRQLRPRR